MISMANVSQTDNMILLVAGVVLGAFLSLTLNGTGTTMGIVAFFVLIVLIAKGEIKNFSAYKLFVLSTRVNKS